MDIGVDRSTIVEANDKGITFFFADGNKSKTYKIRLVPSAVHVMNTFLTSIQDAVELLKSGKMTQKYSLPLGARIFLEIDPKFRCVSLRKFFRPKADPSIILPGSQGIGLKLEEFNQLNQNWYQLLQSIPWEEAPCCYFNKPNEHFNCDYCWPWNWKLIPHLFVVYEVADSFIGQSLFGFISNINTCSRHLNPRSLLWLRWTPSSMKHSIALFPISFGSKRTIWHWKLYFLTRKKLHLT